jgi:hypothetical protein
MPDWVQYELSDAEEHFNEISGRRLGQLQRRVGRKGFLYRV